MLVYKLSIVCFSIVIYGIGYLLATIGLNYIGKLYTGLTVLCINKIKLLGFNID